MGSRLKGGPTSPPVQPPIPTSLHPHTDFSTNKQNPLKPLWSKAGHTSILVCFGTRTGKSQFPPGGLSRLVPEILYLLR